MPSMSLKSSALFVHRWLGLVLAPLFLLIIISGGVLALKPIVEDPRFAAPVTGIEASALVSALEIVDPRGQANQLTPSSDGQVINLYSRAQNGPTGSFAVSSGQMVPEAPRSIDIFGIAKSLHKDLFLGAGLVVLIATYAMLGIIVVGPFLGWLRFRNTVSGWHLAVGWIALPILVLSPLTGILMSLHLGSGRSLDIRQSSPPMALARGVEVVAGNPEVNAITFVRRFQKGSVMVDAQTAGGNVKYIVDATRKATALEGGPGLVKSLHEGTWAGAWSGMLNLATSVLLAGLTVTGLWSWNRRRLRSSRRSGAEDADILVLHASQTGTAAQLAEATFRSLEGGGAKVACMSLSGLRPDELQRYRHVLIIASTTGQGDLAEPGRGFLEGLHRSGKIEASFCILALGDRRYQYFCAGGERLRSALLAAGGYEIIPMIRADGAPETAWRGWLAQIESRLDLITAAVESPVIDVRVSLRLQERIRLDDPIKEDAGETWQVVFALEGEAMFRPGDLLMLSPGEGEPERCYSIGSSALLDPSRIVLTVAQHLWTDDDGETRMGRMSALLCRDMPIGTRLTGSIRCNAHFHPPEDPAIPVIMVATGCGVAPFPGFIEERSAASTPGPTWMMFGNRYREGDFLYRSELGQWRRQGALTQLLTSFSRDDDDGRYITDKIAIHARDIIQLIQEKGAILYICGRARLGRGVEDALVRALIANDNLSESKAEKMVQKWKATGTLRQDLFD